MNYNFEEIVKKKTDKELITILKSHKDDYSDGFILVAKLEFDKRNLSKELIEKVETEQAKMKNVDSILRNDEKLKSSFDPFNYLAVFCYFSSIIVSFTVGIYMIISESQGNVWVGSDRFGGNSGNKSLSGPGFVILGVILLSPLIYSIFDARFGKKKKKRK